MTRIISFYVCILACLIQVESQAEDALILNILRRAASLLRLC